MENKIRLKSYIPLLISLLFGLVLFFLVDDFVVTVAIKPLLKLVWFLSLVVRSIPQDVFWVGFILALLIMTLSGLRKGRKSSNSAIQSSTRKMGTVERWARLLDFAKESRYSKWRLSQQLRRLTQRILSPITAGGEVSKDLLGLELPMEIKEYFEADQPSGYSLMERLNPNRTTPTTGLELDPEMVIQYLEQYFKNNVN